MGDQVFWSSRKRWRSLAKVVREFRVNPRACTIGIFQMVAVTLSDAYINHSKPFLMNPRDLHTVVKGIRICPKLLPCQRLQFQTHKVQRRRKKRQKLHWKGTRRRNQKKQLRTKRKRTW